MPKEKEEKNSVKNKDKKVEALKIIEEKVEEKIDIKPNEKEKIKEKVIEKIESDQDTEKNQEKKLEQDKLKALDNLNYYIEVRKDLPEIKPGDIAIIYYRVIEGGKERIQIFEGTVIALKNSGISKTITVRKNSFGIFVERIFPLNSKLVQKIKIKKHSKVRRAKLYFLRKLKGKAARLKELR